MDERRKRRKSKVIFEDYKEEKKEDWDMGGEK